MEYWTEKEQATEILTFRINILTKKNIFNNGKASIITPYSVFFKPFKLSGKISLFNDDIYSWRTRRDHWTIETIEPNCCIFWIFAMINFLVFVPKFVNLLFLDKINLSSYEFKKFLINNFNAFYLTFNRNFGFFQFWQ